MPKTAALAPCINECADAMLRNPSQNGKTPIRIGKPGRKRPGKANVAPMMPFGSGSDTAPG